MAKQVVTQETYLEFITNSISAPVVSGENSSEEGSADWTGTKNLEEAVNLATNGWDAGIKQLELDAGLMVTGNTTPERAIVGAFPDIGAYLQNQPDCMWEYKDETDYNLPEMEIFVPLVYSAYNDGEAAMEYCRSVISTVNKYQSTHNVKLTGIFDSQQDGVRYINEVYIKDFNAPFVLNNIAFSFHPSFFRRIWFRKLEGETFWAYGYGCSTKQNKIREYILNKGITSESAILLPQLNDVGGAFTEDKIEDLKEAYLKSQEAKKA